MDVRHALFTRRSIRKYMDKPIFDSDLTEIINAGLAAPSASNTQPWYFIVVKNEESMEGLLETMKTMSKKLVPMLKARFTEHPQVVEETRQFVNNLGGAPVCVLAFQDKPGYGETESSIIQSVAAAIQNMIIMAHSIGIGSCWLTAAQETGLDVELKNKYAPDKGNLVALVTFGYPDQQTKKPARKENRYTII